MGESRASSEHGFPARGSAAHADSTRPGAQRGGAAGGAGRAAPGLRAPPASQPPRQGNPGRSRQSVSPRRPPRGHAALRVARPLTRACTVPMAPSPTAAWQNFPGQPSLGWPGQRAGPRRRSCPSAHHPQAPGRSALGASMMPRLGPAPSLIVLSLIGRFSACNPDVLADARKPCPSAERAVTPATRRALGLCVCVWLCCQPVSGGDPGRGQTRWWVRHGFTQVSPLTLLASRPGGYCACRRAPARLRGCPRPAAWSCPSPMVVLPPSCRPHGSLQVAETP